VYSPHGMNNSNVRRLAWGLAIGTGLIYLAFLPPGIYSIDGNSMLAVAESIVTRHSLTVPIGLGIPGQDGQIYSSWYPLQSLLSVPAVMAASGVSRLLHLPLHFVSGAFAGVMPAVFTAATVALVALISLQLGSTLEGARRAALCFAAYLVFVRSKRTMLLAALVALFAVLAKPTGILLGPALSTYLLLKKTPTGLGLMPAAGGGFGLLFYFLYNLLRFGNPLTFGHPWIFSLSALPQGFAGLLFSPGRGILWYSPAVLLAILGFRQARKTKPLEALLIAALFLGSLGPHSGLAYWHGGWSWGPRFLLPILPSLMALTGLLEGKAAKALLYLSFLGFLANPKTLA
jgi:hypothetical protein